MRQRFPVLGDYKFVSTIGEFIRNVDEGDIIGALLKIICDINEKYGKVAFVSGGYAVRKFLRPKCSIGNDIYSFEYSDIDIFLFGESCVNVAKEILERLSLVGDGFGLRFFSRYGLVDIFKGSGDFWLEGTLIVQLIFKPSCKSPNDLFVSYDLDCCKIGWFPGLKCVFASIDFIRSMSTGLNCDKLKSVHKKTFERITKYNHRMGVYSRVDKFPHLLSYYHTFERVKKFNPRIEKADHYIHNFQTEFRDECMDNEAFSFYGDPEP